MSSQEGICSMATGCAQNENRIKIKKNQRERERERERVSERKRDG